MEDTIQVMPDTRYGRGKRTSLAISPLKTTQCAAQNTTPTKRRPLKKTRFSDSAVPSNISTACDASGLTPVIGRASLDTPRRISFPDRIQFTPFRQVLDDRTKRRIGRNGLGEIQNSVAAERAAERRIQKQLLDKIEILQAKLDAATRTSTENPQPNSTTDKTSEDNSHEIEAELHHLQQSFRQQDNVEDHELTVDASRTGEYPRERRGSNDTICIFEDDDTQDDPPTDGTDEVDVFNMGLEIESARQAKKQLLRSARNSNPPSFHMEFQDSPARQRKPSPVPPPTPSSLYHNLSKQLKDTTNRAEDAELALRGFEMEIRALGFSAPDSDNNKLASDIVNQFRQARLELERVVPGETVSSLNDHSKLLPEFLSKMKLLSQRIQDREAELKSMRDQQRSLKGNFEHAIVAAEKANARLKDLEAIIDANAEDMLDLRIKKQSLEKDLTDKESTIQSLITALDKYRTDISRLEALITTVEAEHKDAERQTKAEHSQHVSDLDAKVAAEERGRRAAEESAVTRLSKIQDLEKSLDNALTKSHESEKQVIILQTRLLSLSDTNLEQIGSLNNHISSLATALSSANAEVDKLRTINNKLEERYRNEVEYASRTVEQFQAEVIRCVTKTSESRKSYLRGAKVRLGNWEIESDGLGSDDFAGAEPMTPASLVRFVDVDDARDVAGLESGSDDASVSNSRPSDIEGDCDSIMSDSVPGSVEMSRGRRRYLAAVKGEHGLGIRTKPHPNKKGKGRRSYDSGIGMDSLSEIDEDADGEDDNDMCMKGLITPELSSEADIEIEGGR